MSDAKTIAKQGVALAQTNSEATGQTQTAEKIEETFQKLLPKLAQASLAKLPPEFIVSTAMTVLRNSDDLRECDPLSVVHCVVQSAQTGLRLDPVLQQAALVSRWNGKKKRKEAQFMPMYKGLLLLSRRSGEIAHVAAQPVFDCDEFSYGYGSDQFLKHLPSLKRTAANKPTHIYAYMKLKGGGFQFEVMTWEEVEEIKKFALADKKNIGASPWTTDPIPMALKTVLRRLLKLAPVEDPMLQAAIQADELLEKGILQDHRIENGLVVPSQDAYAAEAEAAEVKPPPVESPAPPVQTTALDALPQTDQDAMLSMLSPTGTMSRSTWVETCLRCLPALQRRGDKETAQSWGREAKKRLAAQTISQKEFDSIVATFQECFPRPPQVLSVPELFDGKGAATPEPPAEKPATKAAPKKSGKTKSAEGVAAELGKQLDSCERLSLLFTIKGRIEKAQLSDTDREQLMSAWRRVEHELKTKGASK